MSQYERTWREERRHWSPEEWVAYRNAIKRYGSKRSGTRMAAAITAFGLWGFGVVCGLVWAALQ